MKLCNFIDLRHCVIFVSRGTNRVSSEKSPVPVSFGGFPVPAFAGNGIGGGWGCLLYERKLPAGGYVGRGGGGRDRRARGRYLPARGVHETVYVGKRGQNGGRVPQRRALRGERRVAGHRQPPERDHGLVYRGRARGRADRRGRERGAGRRHYGRCRNGFRGRSAGLQRNAGYHRTGAAQRRGSALRDVPHVAHGYEPHRRDAPRIYPVLPSGRRVVVVRGIVRAGNARGRECSHDRRAYRKQRHLCGRIRRRGHPLRPPEQLSQRKLYPPKPRFHVGGLLLHHRGAGTHAQAPRGRQHRLHGRERRDHLLYPALVPLRRGRAHRQCRGRAVYAQHRRICHGLPPGP